MSLEFSIIIPTYNRMETLPHCLKWLERVRFPKNEFEVLLIDDGSSDATKDLRDDCADIPLRVIHKPNGGASSARNLGIKLARGINCFFMDDDCLADPDLLLKHREAHLAQPNLMVRGPVINIPKMPPPAQHPPLWKHFTMNYLCTSNASVKRDHLLEAGLFDTTFPRWEDAELGVRLKRLNIRRHFVFDAVIYHLKPPETLEQRLRTARKDGESAADLYLRYPGLAMRLRSGLHPLNTLRNYLFTKGPLSSLFQQSLQGKGPFSQGMAEALAVEQVYLESGCRRLREAPKRR